MHYLGGVIIKFLVPNPKGGCIICIWGVLLLKFWFLCSNNIIETSSFLYLPLFRLEKAAHYEFSLYKKANLEKNLDIKLGQPS